MFAKIESLAIADVCSFVGLSCTVDGKDVKVTETWQVINRLEEFDVEEGRNVIVVQCLRGTQKIWIPGDIPCLIHKTSKTEFKFSDVCRGPFRYSNHDYIKIPNCYNDMEECYVTNTATGKTTHFPAERMIVNAVSMANGGICSFKETEIIPYDSK